jgi:hypothetical protein
MLNGPNLITFFTNQTHNITTVPVPCPFTKGSLKIGGVWDGATIILQTGVPWNPSFFLQISDSYGNPISWTSSVNTTLYNIIQGDPLVMVLSNAGVATSLTATLQRN